MDDFDAFLDEVTNDDGQLEDMMRDKKDGIIFVIDCSRDMFMERTYSDSSTSQSLTPFQMSTRAVLSVIKNKIVSSSDDLVGLIFFNCQETKNATNFLNINVPFERMSVPSAVLIKYLKALDTSSGCSTANISPSDHICPLGNVFWTVANLYGAVKQESLASKRVFFFTSNDHPHHDNPGLKKAARTRAKDLADFGIDLELFNIQPAAKQSRLFDMKPFWGDLLFVGDDLDSDCLDDESVNRFPDSTEKFEELLARVRRRESKKRTLRRTTLTLVPDYQLSIRMYSVYQPSRRLPSTYIDSLTGKPVRSRVE